MGLERKPSCIAIDIGGTKMLIGEVREDGNILNVKRYQTGHLSQDELLQVIYSSFEDYERTIGWSEGKRPGFVGIGVVGIIDPVNKIWNRIEGTDNSNIPLARLMEERYQLTCFIDNDVKAGTIAECVFGAGKGCKDLIYINVGTGLAAGIVVNGRLVRGSDHCAGEIGYLDFSIGKKTYKELSVFGYIEGVASGLGIKQRGFTSGEELFALAMKKDEKALQTLADITEVLTTLIHNLAWITNPEKVILGGGLMSEGWLLEQLISSMGSNFPEIKKGIVLTELNPAYTGLMGAAAIGMGYQKQF